MVRALTLDLDDTLWAIAPVIARAEAAQHAYLQRHCPRTAERYSIEGFRALRETVAREQAQLSHDFTTQRLLALRHALRDSGEHEQHAEPAFAAFFQHRNTVELFPDVPQALESLARSHPLAALTNGNADLVRIGLDQHFRFSLGAREHGAAKPATSIFLAACARLEREPSEVLHVGDDPWMDVQGAAQAGLATCWINRFGHVWPQQLDPPDVEVESLAELVVHLDNLADQA